MNNSPPLYVLDSYALLAYFGQEDGAEQVRELLVSAMKGETRTLMSIINLGELAYITERARGLARAQEVLALIDQFPIDIIPADRRAVLAAAHIKAGNAVAYADAFAIAVARFTDGVLVTGDPEFRVVENLIRVLWIGEQNIEDA